MNQQRASPKREQRGEREAQRDFGPRPTVCALEVVVKKRDVVVRNADGEA